MNGLNCNKKRKEPFELKWKGKLSHLRYYFANYIRVISLSLYPFSLSKRRICYKTSRASVSRAFMARNPISMKRRNKRLQRKTNITFQDDTPRGYVRVVCVNSSGLSAYSRENLTVLSRKYGMRNHYRNSACLLAFMYYWVNILKKNWRIFENLFATIKLKL